MASHSTLSAEDTEVQVFYPFHPLNSTTVQILRRPERGDGAVSVIDRTGEAAEDSRMDAVAGSRRDNDQ